MQGGFTAGTGVPFTLRFTSRVSRNLNYYMIVTDFFVLYPCGMKGGKNIQLFAIF